MAKRHYGHERSSQYSQETRGGGDAKGNQGHMMHDSMTEQGAAPSGFHMKKYPEVMDYMPYGMDDTITQIDRQMNGDSSTRNRHLKPRKA